jgi:hypothetical protein
MTFKWRVLSALGKDELLEIRTQKNAKKPDPDAVVAFRNIGGPNEHA